MSNMEEATTPAQSFVRDFDTRLHSQARLPRIEAVLEQQIREETLEMPIVNPDERRANAVNAVLHAKGILATITPADASAIWRIVLELESISG